MKEHNFKQIIFEKKENIATITLNRPKKLNAMTDLMLKEILDAVRDVKRDSNIQVLILRGAGGAFSAGQDLSETQAMKKEDVKGWLKSWDDTLLEILNVPIPSILMINGHDLGGAFQLTLLTDMRIASETSTFGIVEVNAGIPSIPGLYLMASAIGVLNATPLVLTSEIFDAKEAWIDTQSCACRRT